MLDALKFVKSAVGKQGVTPVLRHFKIQGGTIRSFNGSMALSSPIALDIDCVPNADTFIKAIASCHTTASLSLTKSGRLKIVSDNFKVFINCLDEETPHVRPEGKRFSINGEAFLKALTTLLPFVNTGSNESWSNGVLIKDHSLYATNNKIIIQYWANCNFPKTCNLPLSAVKEIVRINIPPISAQFTDSSVSFHYPNERWIRSATISAEWPDVEPILDIKSQPKTIHNELFNGLDLISSFVDVSSRIYLNKDGVSTSSTDKEGACYKIKGLDMHGVYQLESLEKLKGTATSADFSHYPKPCTFYGDNLRGAIIGLRP